MRKLATAALAFSAAIFLANYILPEGRLIGSALVSAALGAALLLLRRRWLRPAVLALLFFALGLGEYAVFCRLTVDRAREYAGQTREVRGVVLDYPEEYAGYNRLRVRIASDGLPRFKAIVYDNEKALSAAEPGDSVSFTAKLSTADTLYGEPYDNYILNGFYLRMSIKGGEALEKGGFSLSALPVRVHRTLCERVDTVFPAESRAFIKALMLGDKQELYEDDALYVAMSRAGLMHVVAVSGLHIAFLVSLMVLLLGRGRRSACVGIALIWCFALVTGSSKSVLRAAFMQTLLLLAPILRRENDPITSLSAALALILLANPFAARSVSVQLSFAAMAGLICFGERLRARLSRFWPKRLSNRLTRYVFGVIASTLSVMVFTVPLTALHFSYVPLLALLSNLACIWAVSVCFGLAWFACLLSAVPIAGTALGWACAQLSRYILFCARLVSGFPYAVLYLNTEGALCWMGFSYTMLLVGLLLRRRRVLRFLLPAGLSLAMLFCVILRTERFYRQNDCVSVLNVGQGQCITAFAGEVTAVIDCGNISNLDDAGSIAGEYLFGCGRKSVELLILTHLHADHADGAVRLMEMLPVDTLILPADFDDRDGLYDSIRACAERRGTRLVPLDGSAEASCGRMRLSLYKLMEGGNENERCLMVKLAIGETELLVTADAPKKTERALTAQEDLSGTDIFVVGHHGSKNASAGELLQEVGGGLAVLSVGYNNYGHPAQETLDALAANSFQLYRTDEDGTVEIRLGRNDG